MAACCIVQYVHGARPRVARTKQSVCADVRRCRGGGWGFKIDERPHSTHQDKEVVSRSVPDSLPLPSLLATSTGTYDR